MSDEKRCGNCKHWVDPEPGFAWGYGEEDVAYRACDWVGWLDGKGKSAFVEDGSGYYAALRCRADFGCVAWEAAEPKDAGDSK